MPKTLIELYDARAVSVLRNRVEVAADRWVLGQAGREPGQGEDSTTIAKYQHLAYDAMVDPNGTRDRLMRMAPLAAEAAGLDLDDDATLVGLVAELMDKYALTRPGVTNGE